MLGIMSDSIRSTSSAGYVAYPLDEPGQGFDSAFERLVGGGEADTEMGRPAAECPPWNNDQLLLESSFAEFIS
jgi:hypothetical protein